MADTIKLGTSLLTVVQQINTNFAELQKSVSDINSTASSDKTALEAKIKANADAIAANKTAADASIKTLTDGKANKATTLAGYGITDAKIANGVITLGSNTITPLTAHQSLAGYYKKTETYSQTEVNAKLADLQKGLVAIVDKLPDTGDAGKIYLVKTGTETQNVYTEYVYVNSAWEKLGEQKLDLSGYLTKTDAAKTYLGISATAAAAAKLTTTTAGSATNPVYFANGVPVKTTYTLAKSVPADAKFTDTTYQNATQSAAGLMAAADKSKLDNLHAVATSGSFDDLDDKPTIDASLSATSTNAVQNKAVQAALNLKANLASPNFSGTPTIGSVAVATANTVATAKSEAIKAAKDESDKKDTVKVLAIASDKWTDKENESGVYVQSVAAANLYPTGLVYDSNGTSILVDITKAAAADAIVITSMVKFAGSVVVSTRH